ncbi:MAG: orotate phosphoribosyltransferase [Candidatus Omnitrophota bacterium]
MQKDKERLLELLKRDAFFKEKVVLSSGKESDFYIDARRITLHPEGVYLCAKIILNMIQEDAVDAIGGPTLGADAIVGAIAVLSHEAGKPLNGFIIRKKPKAHGKQQQIEGPLLFQGARVILIDDVATSGQSLVESLEICAKMNVSVVKAICLVDRQEGAQEALAGKNCSLISIFNLSDFSS